MNKLKVLVFSAVIFLAFVLSACHEDFLIIHTRYTNARYLDSNHIVFVHRIKASQPPKGISRFPDGGIHKPVFQNTSLYYLDLENKSLEKIDDFGYYPFETWITHVSKYKDTLIYSVRPALGWEHQKNNSLNPDTYVNLEKKFGGIFLYDLNTQQKQRLIVKGFTPEISNNGQKILYLEQDSIHNSVWVFDLKSKQKHVLYQTELSNKIYSHLWDENSVLIHEKEKQITINPEGKISISEVEYLRKKREFISRAFFDSVLTNIKYSDWGFELKQHWQKSLNEYYGDIALLNGNFAYRKAIIEEFGNEFSKKEIEKLIKQIEKQSRKLEGFQKTKYDYTSKETLEMLRRLIE